MRVCYGQRSVSILMLAACLTGSTSPAQQTALGILEFPKFRLYKGAADGPYFAASGARLCLGDDARTCFELHPIGHGDPESYFGLHPKAERIPLASGGSLVFFFANTGGGSGSTDRYALLQYERDGSLRDLLPAITLTNQSDHALWDVPTVSDMPLLVTADYLWGAMEAHYGAHFYEIRAYRYDPATGKYAQILKYETGHQYRGFDNTSDDPFPLLKFERATVLQKLAAR
jgi:hypothetical protein